MEVPVYRVTGIPLLYGWVRYGIVGGYSYGGWIPPPTKKYPDCFKTPGAQLVYLTTNMRTLTRGTISYMRICD